MNKVHNTRISSQLRQLHEALLDILSVMNEPQRDVALLREAGIKLDRALFPLLVGIARFGPIGVVELAARVGRDHTTVSRQVAKLESLGLVDRQPGAADGRVREALVSPAGEAAVKRLDAARERIGKAVLSGWEEGELDDLVRLMRRFADAIQQVPSEAALD
jgi:DNA-binding MarR family transcriptional regulator